MTVMTSHYRPSIGDFAWLAEFDAEGQATFQDEYSDALAVADRSGDSTVLDECLDDWKRTARALSDPDRRAILTGSGEDEDEYAEVEAPASHGTPRLRRIIVPARIETRTLELHNHDS
jgi:hypothetical protein